MPKCKYKISYGVALCRYNIKKNNRFEILLVKKRYTYHFFNFVFGKYKKYNNNQIKYLFNNMTFGEKIDILSLNFNKIWYRLWLSDPEKTYNDYKVNKNNLPENTCDNLHLKHYFRKKNKFESIFLRDGSKRLKKIINNSTNAETPWEIPKGRKKYNEKDLTCAIREFKEETNISSDKYTILWKINPIKHSFKDDNIIYKYIYYVASLDEFEGGDFDPKIKFNTYQQVSEIEKIKWVSLNEIEFLQLNHKTKNSLLKLFNDIKFNFNKYNIIKI